MYEKAIIKRTYADRLTVAQKPGLGHRIFFWLMMALVIFIAGYGMVR